MLVCIVSGVYSFQKMQKDIQLSRINAEFSTIHSLFIWKFFAFVRPMDIYSAWRRKFLKKLKMPFFIFHELKINLQLIFVHGNVKMIFLMIWIEAFLAEKSSHDFYFQSIVGFYFFKAKKFKAKRDIQNLKMICFLKIFQ